MTVLRLTPFLRLLLVATLAMWLGAQSLGLAHRTLHVHQYGHADGAAAAAVVADADHDPFGHADGDGPQCQLFDQLASGEALTGAIALFVPPAPAVVPTFFHAAWQLAAQAAGFLARGPPPIA